MLTRAIAAGIANTLGDSSNRFKKSALEAHLFRLTGRGTLPMFRAISRAVF